MTVTHDFIEDSTEPMWDAEQRAAVLYLYLNNLVEAIDRFYFETPHVVTSHAESARKILKEINGQ